MARNRRAAYLAGLDAEWLAAMLLRLKGYRILARRFVAAGGEIDLIAKRFGTLVFVEVKARGDIDAARASISPEKRARIARAARVFLARQPVLPATIRLDAVFISPHALPHHQQAIGEIDLN